MRMRSSTAGRPTFIDTATAVARTVFVENATGEVMKLVVTHLKSKVAGERLATSTAGRSGI